MPKPLNHTVAGGPSLEWVEELEASVAVYSKGFTECPIPCPVCPLEMIAGFPAPFGEQTGAVALTGSLTGGFGLEVTGVGPQPSPRGLGHLVALASWAGGTGRCWLSTHCPPVPRSWEAQGRLGLTPRCQDQASTPSTVPRQGAYPQWVPTFLLAHIHSYGDNSEPPLSHFPLTAPPHSKPLSF